LALNVALGVDEVFQDYRRLQWLILVIGGLATLAAAAGVWRLGTEAERREGARLALAAERDRLRGVMDALDGPAAVYDADDRLEVRNTAYERFFPRMRDVLRVGVDRATIRHMLVERGYFRPGQALASDDTRPELMTSETLDGRTFFLRRIPLQGGGFLALLTDVTALRQAERRLEAAIASIGDAFVLYDREERLVTYNNAYLRQVSPIASRIRVGMSYAEVIALGCDAGMVALPTSMTRDEFVASRLAASRAGDGKALVVQFAGRWLKVANYRTPDGETVRVATDVTEMREKEQSLRVLLAENEELSSAALARRTFMLQAVMDGIPDGLAILDDARRVSFWNRGFLRLAELAAPSQAMPVSLDRLSLQELLSPFALPAGTMDGLAQGEAHPYEHVVAGGRMYRFQLLRAGPGSGLLWVSDITLRRQAEDERAALRERAMKAERNDAVGTIVGTVAHDFNICWQ